MKPADAPPIAIPDMQTRPVPPVEGMAPGDLGAWLDWATRTLRDASPSARADAEELMAAQRGLRRSQIDARFEDALSAAEALRYAGAVERRRIGEPVAYITGRQGFWNLDLTVNPAVLIPRADTETLVEWALQWARARGRAVKIADLGTGSGAIALALARELGAGAHLVATDQSEAALQVAKDNAKALGLGNVEFRAGDWLTPLNAGARERFDLIVSNPPYIAHDDVHLDALRYEPRLALISGADGLDAIRHLVVGASAHLVDGGRLLLEHGHDQGAATRDLLSLAGFVDIQTRRDFGGNERASSGRRA